MFYIDTFCTEKLEERDGDPEIARGVLRHMGVQSALHGRHMSFSPERRKGLS